jgi:hypothetical protein
MMTMKHRILTVAILLTSTLALCQMQEAPQSIHLSHILKRPIVLSDQPLSAFMNAISSQTNAAICLEDVFVGNSNTFDNFVITLSTHPGATIRDVLDQFHTAYPQIAWTVQNGIIIFRATALRQVKDNPLDSRTTTDTVIKGGIDEVKGYLAADIPDFHPAIIETKGALWRSAEYDIKIKAGTSARDVLIELTRKYGVKWHASVRPDQPHKNEGDEGARVSVRLFGGSTVPTRVIVDEQKGRN